MKKNGLIFLVALLSCFCVIAQKGIIKGTIIDKLNNETLVGATVMIENPKINAVTDIDGNYSISIASGSYTLKLSYVGYETASITVSVKANEVVSLNYAMEEARALKEVVVKATADRSNSAVLMIERKKATQVSDGISSDLIRKSPDRTTSDVLKRITGATIQDGKFAIIRGMNDRYNVGLLDGALLPSTESDRKAFAFDVVPASLLDNLMVIKAGSPDMVGDFGGGIIKINTKSVPETFTQNINIGGQYHSLTTYKPYSQFKIYSNEKLNLLSKERNIPTFDEGALKINGVFPTSADEVRLAAISKNFNNDWSNSMTNAAPNSRLAYSLGLPIKINENSKLGLIIALNYANTRRILDGSTNSYDGAGQTSAFQDKNYSQNISSGGLFNVNFVGAKTKINFRNLLNINSDNNTIYRTGVGNIQDAITVRNTANLLNYNRLYNGIFSVKQIVGNNLFEINASANFSSIHRKIPDYRIISYTKSPDFDDYRISLGDFFNSSTGRFSSDLKENIYGTNIELSKALTGVKVRTEIKGGFFYQQRDRDFWGRNFVYAGTSPTDVAFNPASDLADRNIGIGKLFLVEKTSNDLAFYQGKSKLSAGYLMADQTFAGKLRAVYGVRYETINLSVDNPKIVENIATINQNSWLPSVNMTWYVSGLMNIRADYFSSVNRPEFRELAPFAFYVFDKNAEIKGNKDLKIATLQNYDLRFELFPEGNQVLSIGGFYKKILNPIEQSIDITQPTTTFTYDNEKLANIYGLEFEARKNLEFLGKAKLFKNITIYSNLSLIKSSLKFEEGAKAKQNRPLQGQSPYIFNAGIQYDDRQSGWFGSIAANRFGRRVAYVGVDAKFGATRQDIYEAPRTVLDFQIGKNIKRFNIKLTFSDLLQRDLIFYQDANTNGKYNAEGGDLLMFKYNNGFTGTLNVGYIF